MNVDDIDKPFRITGTFLVCMVIVAVPVFYFWRPWESDQPWYSILAGCIFFPFFATLCIYCPIAFIGQVFKSGDRGRSVLKRFVLVVSGVIAILAVIYYLGYIELVDSWIALPLTVAAIVAMGGRPKGS